ncbi:MAG: histidine kinase, partial [Bacteroidota bacterium]
IAGDNFQDNFLMSSYNGFYIFFFAKEKKKIKHFLRRELKEGQFGEVMRGFAGDGNNKVYVVEEGTQWYEVNTDNLELNQLVIQDENGNAIENISCGSNLYFDRKYLWGTSCNENKRGRIHRYDPQTQKWKLYQLPEQAVYARMIIPKSENELWIFTIHRYERNGNIYIFDKSNGTCVSYAQHSGKKPPLQKKSVQYVTKDEGGKLWIGTNDGLIKFDPQQQHFEIFKINPNSQSGNSISAIHESANGKLWVGAFEVGLHIFDKNNNAFSRFSPSHFDAKFNATTRFDLPNNYVAAIQPINEKEYIITTFTGLAYWNLEEGISRHFFEEDGLGNQEFNRLSSYLDHRGNIFLGGINGFDVFKLEDLKEKKTPLRPNVTRFFQYHEKMDRPTDQYAQLDFKKKIIIPPNNIFFGFDFMIPHYRNAKNNAYQTRLVGWENDFSPPTNEPTVQYHKLPAGDYSLHIRAKDARGNATMNDLVIPIRVQEVFYKTWWFGALCLLGLAFAIFYLVKRRIKKIERRQKIEAEKRDNQRRFLELELKTLRMQLNPHFMFNALGAIQYYIKQNDKRLAINYLADFARLMRLFLESSKKKFILLEEELELIRLYTSLERMRFNNKFEVTYEIDESLDLGMVEIPSLLLQPFIENSINHGLRHKQNDGHLLIRMIDNEAKDMIQCIIEDDGIGRERAALLKKQSLKTHKSRGTQIVQERLDAFKKSGDLQLEVITEDVNPTLVDCGTRVIVNIPNV